HNCRPDNYDKLLILTGDAYGSVVSSIGILQSSDGGNTWQETGLSHESNSNIFYFKMEVLPSNKDIILVAGSQGIMRSEDGGETWTEVMANRRFTDMVVHPENDSIIYASIGSRSTTEVRYFISTDTGLTWERKSFPLPETSDGIIRTALAVSPAEPDYLYLLGTDTQSGFAGLFRSVDSGETLELQINSPNIIGRQGQYDLAIAVNPEDADEIFVGGFYTFRSSDGGKNFKRLHEWTTDVQTSLPYMHPDIHTLDFYNGKLYTGNDGGIYMTEDSGDTWQDISQGLGITQFYRLGQDPNDAEIVIGGTQDNGSNIYKDGQWFHIFGADGMEALVDYEDGNTVYSSFQFGGIVRYNQQGDFVSSQIGGQGITETGGWITPFMLDPVDHETIYAGYSQLYKSEDQGRDWSIISEFGSSSLITDFDIARTNPDIIYVTDGTLLYRTRDGGEVWTEVSRNLPNATISKIEVSENNPNRIWVTISGFVEGEKVYRSTNGGSTWENYSEGLPNVVTYCIVQQEGTDDQLYIGTDIGVYQRKLDMDSWEYFSDGLPSVITRELEIHYGSGKLRAATFGRGIWETDIIESTSTPIVLNSIEVSDSDIAVDLGVIYEAETEGFINDYFWNLREDSLKHRPTSPLSLFTRK
ncbi:MAG: hypothetical protein AAFO69_15350, partial [Bacteroidota bacterium]